MAFSVVSWRKLGFNLIAGTDEVGRGCLAGPVYAAAVVLCPKKRYFGFTDSKLIEADRRTELALEIKASALSWAVAWATVEEIDELNILHGSLLAMRRAVEKLHISPELVLIDGNRPMGGAWRQMTVIKGDLRCQPISAASIIAKVARDHYMAELDEKYPGYGFREHKGYGTPNHLEAIARLGPHTPPPKNFPRRARAHQISRPLKLVESTKKN